MKNWTIIHIFPLNRVNTTPFIFQKKSFLYLNAKKISVYGIVPPYLIF